MDNCIPTAVRPLLSLWEYFKEETTADIFFILRTYYIVCTACVVVRNHTSPLPQFLHEMLSTHFEDLDSFQTHDLSVCGECASFDRVLRQVVNRDLVPDVVTNQAGHKKLFK